MISINFTGHTLAEVAHQAGNFVATVFAGQVVTSDVAIKTAAIDPLPLDGHNLVPSPEAVEAAKRKRRTKAEMEAARAAEGARDAAVPSPADVFVNDSAIETLVEATAATPAPVAAAPEVVDVKAALMTVVEKDGLGPTAGGKLLAQFGVKRVSELDAKTFADFIAACNAAVVACDKLLAKFGVKGISDLDPEKQKQFAAALVLA